MYNTLKKLTERGYKVTFTEEVAKGGVIKSDNPHFFQVLIERDESIKDGKSPQALRRVKKIQPIEELEKAWDPNSIIDKMLVDAWNAFIENH